MKNKTVLTRLLARTSRFHKARLNTIIADRKIDLSSEMCGVMVELWESDGRYLQELADTFKKDKGGLNKIVNSLERRKLVRRKKDKADRRRKIIELTEKGKGLEEKVLPLIENLRETMLATISDEDLKHTETILFKIIHNLDTFK